MDAVDLTIEESAIAFVQWAGARGVISRDLIIPVQEDKANRINRNSLFSISSDLFESRSAGEMISEVLRNINVTLVGYSAIPKEIRVYHRKRLLRRDSDNLPKSIKGDIKVSYHHVGEDAVVDDRAAHPAASVSPVFATNGHFTCGTSIGIGPFQGAGTLGCLVKNDCQEMFGLTNNHVIGGSNYAPKNIPVLAPAPTDMLSMKLLMESRVVMTTRTRRDQ
jgi:hypothetical protein